MKGVLNVGGGSSAILIPAHYRGWDHIRLDVDPAADPDIVCDARELESLPAGVYDAVYCSHNLEHYWRHDLPRVLKGFAHVLTPEGFAEVAVPDLRAVFERVQRDDMDLDDVLYQSPAGPITVNDVVYGFGREIAESGNDFYAHKNAFTAKSLARAFAIAGFGRVLTTRGPYEIRAFAFKGEPTAEQRALLKLA
jgi:predicted SAM-dependent methyltransferase